ncbi:hypothetical protein LLG96_14195 [bacterium]|nr:hypothetical protein [bacterium]
MAEFLDFAEISQRIPFADVLDYLNIPYTTKGKELRGEGFIVDTGKNLYFNPKGDDKGSVINFLQARNGGTLRDCAIELKKHFLDEPKKPERDIPTLELDHGHVEVTNLGIGKEAAEFFDIGYCGRKSIMAGKIAFKIIDHNNDHIGYVGLKDGKWFFPKGFKRDTIYNLYRQKKDAVIVVVSVLEVVHLHSLGFPFVVGLMGKSATGTQLELLQKFKRILLLHPEPENIRNRLCEFSFVKTPKLAKPVLELTGEDVSALF